MTRNMFVPSGQLDDDDDECPPPHWVSPSFGPASEEECHAVHPAGNQAPLDEVDEASMESFPASDPPSYTHTHI